LLTDGAVENEREICLFLKSEARVKTRIMTLGIGGYCNYYFLMMAAQVGRGFCEIALGSDRIYPQMTHLLEMANVPVLTDVGLDLPGVDQCEIYPFPVPDLCCGAPLIISGKYEGDYFPSELSVDGNLANGKAFTTKVPTTHAGDVPVEKVFVKQRLELLTSKAWMQNSEQVMEQVVSLSTEHGMPCAHTSMVAIETTPEKYDSFNKKHGIVDDTPMFTDDDEVMIGNKGGQSSNEVGVIAQQPKSKVGAKKLSHKQVAGLAVGGVAVLGASAVMFGDVGATLGNLGFDGFGGMGDMDFDMDMDADGCCDDCDCDDCACDDCVIA